MECSEHQDIDVVEFPEAEDASATALAPQQPPTSKPISASFDDSLSRQLAKASGALETIFSRADTVDPRDDSYAHAQSSHYDNAAKLMKASARLVQAMAEFKGKKLDKRVTIRNEHIGFIPKSLIAVPSDRPALDAKPAEAEPEPASSWR